MEPVVTHNNGMIGHNLEDTTAEERNNKRKR